MTRSHLASLVLGPVLGACQAPCPAFEDMTVADSTGRVEAEDLDGTERAIAAFARLSGRTGVCVPGFEVVDDLHANGRYQGVGAPILLSPRSAGSARVARHELCHGVDELEDLYSEAPGFFEADEVRRTKRYPTRQRRAREAFARACDDGPREQMLSRRLDAMCGGARSDAEGAWLRDQVWWEVPLEPLEDDTRPLSLERQVLPAFAARARVRALTGTDEAVFFVVEHGATGKTTPALDLGPRRVELVGIDPWTGAETTRFPLAQDVPAAAGWSILAGHTPLIVTSHDRTQAWFLDPEGPTLAQVSVADQPFGHELTGAVLEDEVWHWQDDPDGGRLSVLPVSDALPNAPTRTGVETPACGETTCDPLPSTTGLRWLRPHGDGLLGLGNTGWTRWSEDGAEITTWPVTWRPRGFGRLDAETWVVGVAWWTSPLDRTETALLLYEPSTHRWWLPETACGSTRPGAHLSVVEAAGAVWLYEFGAAEDQLQEGQRYLSRLSLP